MLDVSLVTTGHLLVLAAVFAGLSATFAYEARRKYVYIGVPLAAGLTLASWVYLPAGGARIGFLVATLIIALIGKMDEFQPLSAKWQLIWQLAIAAVLVISGWSIPYISNPFGDGVIMIPGILAAALTIGWVLVIMNAVNWLDGADGLAGGVTLVGCLALAAVAMLPAIYNASALGIALAGAGALAAFFVWNFPPAKVYLGTVGSWFVGMFIALAAITGGGKIATTCLILALPILDMAFVLLQRLIRRQPVWKGDTISHMHHRLLRVGVPAKHILAAAIVVTFWFGIMSVLLATTAKLIVLAAGVVGTLVVGIYFWQRLHTEKESYEETKVVHHR